MTQIKRPAPDPEWVQMYRQGLSTAKIAAGAGVAKTTVRYHIAIAAKQDRGLRAAHAAAVPTPGPRFTAAGRRNVDDILTLHRNEARLPGRRTSRERALASWLNRRRKEAACGTLSPAYGDALDVIPGWRQFSTKQADDAARWTRHLAEVATYRAAGHQWPRLQKTDDQEERVLGVWLHTQRIDYRAGKLAADKERQLNEFIPGWREGRPRRGANSSPLGSGGSGLTLPSLEG